jgi:site-specific recombinase XerD
MRKALAPSTAKIYDNQMKKLFHFCSELKATPPRCFRDDTVEMWIARLHKEGLAHNSISSHLSAVRNYYLRHNIRHRLDTPRIRLLLKGVKRSRPAGNTKTVITMSHMRRLSEAGRRILTKPEQCRFKSMISLAFYGFLRPSELCTSVANHHLRWGSVKLSKKHRSIKLTLKSFKHYDHPSSIKIQATTGPYCPVGNFLVYAKLGRRPSKEPLIDMTVAEFQETLSRVAVVAKIKSRITPHCFRHGGATWAAKSGWPDARIRAHGRWRSDAFKHYVGAA